MYDTTKSRNCTIEFWMFIVFKYVRSHWPLFGFIYPFQCSWMLFLITSVWRFTASWQNRFSTYWPSKTDFWRTTHLKWWEKPAIVSKCLQEFNKQCQNFYRKKSEHKSSSMQIWFTKLDQVLVKSNYAMLTCTLPNIIYINLLFSCLINCSSSSDNKLLFNIVKFDVKFVI